jgi:hypothetical protein
MPMTPEEERAYRRARYATRKIEEPDFRRNLTERRKEYRKIYDAKRKEDPEHVEKRRTYNREYMRKYNQKIRTGEMSPRWLAVLSTQQEEVLSDFRKDGCLICGEDDPACLDAHHLDPGAKEHNIGRLKTARIDRLVKELGKCVCLCRNCHSRFHAGRFTLVV